MDKCSKSSEYDVKTVEIIKVFRPISGALSRPQLKSNFNQETFARKSSPSIDLQIDDIWKQKTSVNSRLYNASKFRLARWYMSKDECVLDVGLTNYKDVCGTNLSPNCQSYQEKGIAEFGDPLAYISNGIGVGILLMTKDDCLIVVRRASWTGEYPGMLDRPGGHPEPDLVLTPEGNLKPEIQDHFGVNDAVMNEIWNSPIREVEDEIGISKDLIQDMKFLGISYNLAHGGRTGLEFFARLDMTSEEVRQVYQLGKHSEADETTSLLFIRKKISALLFKLLLQRQDDANPGEDLQKEEEEEPQQQQQQQTDPSNSNCKTECSDSESFVEAKTLVNEATPYLKACLMLARAHCLI